MKRAVLFCFALGATISRATVANAAEPDVTPPRIATVEPAPGAVAHITNVVCNFTEPVVGVRAIDLFLGSSSATAVEGSGARYSFTFDEPTPGPVELRWDADTLITDLASPANKFDPVAAGTWQYEVADRTAPRLAEISPRPGVTVRSLTEVEIRFSEPVEGIDAADLLVNGVAATSVAGQFSGPYVFQFGATAAGRVRFSWSPNHGIHDGAKPPNPFFAEEWSVEVNSNQATPTIFINEFLTANISASGLKDEDGELQDWIEIHNPGAAAISLEGWSLTDDRNDPNRWVFPAVSLGPRQFLVVFASGKDRKPTTAGARLHTNFKLNPAGEHLALLNQESPRIPSSVFNQYPEQRNDYSYGFDNAGPARYFRTPTPGAANATSTVEGVVPPPHVNIERGWFEAPFTLMVTSPISGVTHRYTADGSEPTETTGKPYTAPLRISSNAVLRIASFKSNLLPSSVSTHTYLFPDEVLRQPNNPPGFPVGPKVMGGYPADYEMDPEIVTNPSYSGLMKDALLALPVMSIACKIDDMFGAANGIYTHSTTRGPAWERPCSVEFMPADGSRGFATTAGVQVQGNAAREPIKQPKHPLRLVFKGDYGPSWLEYSMFPDSPVTRFDTLVLRADFNFSWLHWDPNQRLRGQRTRDSWMKDSMRAMGGLASHNRYVHLFINGLYWGIYDPSERPDGAFAASYLGGQKEDYDVMNEGAAVDGDNRAYNVMLGIANLANASAYAQMQQYLDVMQYIDYMLLHFYVGHQDWGQNKNWYAMRPKNGHSGYRFVPWDGENILDAPTYNRVSNTDTPSGLHSKLVANAEYRLAFADRVQKHLFNGGALTPEATSSRWRNRARQVELAVVAESARWGDYRRDVHRYQSAPYELYTRDNQWRTEQNRLLSQYFPQRTSTVLSQLRAANLYPTVAAPGLIPFGGRVARGSSITVTAADGTIYFTTDGSDPRVPITGAVTATAKFYAAPIALDNSVRIKARTLRQGTWSALTEANFNVDEVGVPLRITEINYHPMGGDAFEFVEFQNIGSIPVDVTGFSFSGLEFVFPHRTVVNPGQIAVLATSSSPSSFAARYPGITVTGYFDGSLANGGERLELRDREGRSITSVTYGDAGAWPIKADGGGYSLEVIDPNGDPNDPANWRASAVVNGAPGQPSQRPPDVTLGSVVINEILARSSDDATTPSDRDWIELANTSDATASIAGWTLTDHGAEPFVFPTGMLIPAHSYLVVFCDGLTNAAGLHARFKLDRKGETIDLYDAANQRLDAITFGLQVPGFSVARLGDENRWSLAKPTAGAANISAELAAIDNLKINEWLANSRPGEDDWLELYNSDLTHPAALKGLWLSTSNALFQLQSLSFVPPGGFARLFADEKTGAEHLNFRLTANGGQIQLLDSVGKEIDRVVYAAQTEAISEGRLPDGASSIVTFPGTASPGQSNRLTTPQGVILNEVLTFTAGNSAGWVELGNSAGTAMDVSGFQISLEADGGKAWTIPAGTLLGPGEFLVIGFDAARPASVNAGLELQAGRALSATGGSVFLRDHTGRVVDSVEYGMQAGELSIGRSNGAWRLLASPTPGKANSAEATLGPVSAMRFNEWLASPFEGDDWFELFNSDTRPVALAGLHLTDDPSVTGANKFTIGPLSFVAGGGWALWKADSASDKGPNHVNFSLDQLGESLRLYALDGSVIDAVDFGLQPTGVSEGRITDGGSEIGPLIVGPTPGASNIAPSANRDTDGDGLPDAWEIGNGTTVSLRDAEADPDGDGLTNLQEFLAGTNPLNASSSLKVTRVNLSAGSVAFEFQAAANHTYSVLFKRSMQDQVWSKLADIAAKSSDHLETVTDTKPADSARFYKIVTPAQP